MFFTPCLCDIADLFLSVPLACHEKHQDGIAANPGNNHQGTT
jgi:hypothetical protein